MNDSLHVGCSRFLRFLGFLGSSGAAGADFSCVRFRMTLSRLLFLTIFTVPLAAATLPGFRVETLAQGEGFVSSVAVDSHGTVYFTTTDGWIQRIDGVGATKIASLPTHTGGNGGLLGMALLDDATAVVHYTTWNDATGSAARVLDDVISYVDLATGAETVLHTFVCDIQFRARGVSAEHHGGNPTIGPDGSVFVGIGEYNGGAIAQYEAWNGGKIWRIDADGTATQWAKGVRNPFDLAWDPELERVIVADNGPQGGDELNVVDEGDNCGWPDWGSIPDAIEPAYVFPHTVAPTGLHRLRGTNDMLRRGYISAAFVTSALYYFPSITGVVSDPLPLLEFHDEYVLDVAEGPEGEIIFATASFAGTSSIHRLHVPKRGDCNGDLRVDRQDLEALTLELGDGEANPMITAQSGSYAGSWGCDTNADGLISDADLETLRRMVAPHRRSVRAR